MRRLSWRRLVRRLCLAILVSLCIQTTLGIRYLEQFSLI
jgi:hypothetical protein